MAALTQEQFNALRKDGATIEQIARFEAGETPDTMSTVREHARSKPKSKSLRERAPEIGQAVGGFAGGLAGGTMGIGAGPAAPVVAPLGAIGGAGVGGETGRGIGNLIAGRPFGEGVGEAGMTEMAWQSLGPLAKAGGKVGMRLAMKVTPQVAQTAIREGITATDAGWKLLKDRIKATGATERQIVRVAQGKGQGWVNPVDFIRPVFAEVAEKVSGGGRSAVSEASQLMEKFLKDFPFEKLSPTQLLKIRKFSDIESGALKKFGAKPTTQAEKLWQNAVSNRAREVLRTEIPAIADPQAYLKLTGKETTPHDLQLVQDALRTAIDPEGKFARRVASTVASQGGRVAVGTAAGAGLGAIPGDHVSAWEGALIGGALMHPAVLSWLALRGSSPVLGQALTQGPRVVQALSE